MGRTSDAVAEGLAIAAAAARLAVRNRILVETIAQGGQFDPAAFAAFARETLLSLAEEQERAGSHMKMLRRRAWGRFSSPDGTHDYRDRDTRNLRRRQRQYLGVAKELREWADDEERVSALVDAARDAAWGDVEANLQRRLAVEGMTPDADPEYESMRQARLDAFRMIDLARLAAQAKRRAKEDRTEGQSAEQQDAEGQNAEQ